MKNQLFALIGLGLLLATASAYAQTGLVKANVPFNFIVNKAEIPAGSYSIQNISTNGQAMVIQSADRNLVQVILPNSCQSSKPQEKTKLVFHRYGDRYFLAQVWVAGMDRGSEFKSSEREAEMAMDYPVQDVVVVATLR